MARTKLHVDLQTQGDLPLARLAEDVLPLSGGTMAGSIDMGGHSITNIVSGAGSSDLVNKAYVDNKISGLSWQEPVIGITGGLPAAGVTGARYVLSADVGAGITNDIAIDTGAGWTFVHPGINWAVLESKFDAAYTYNAEGTGFKWVQFSGAGQITAASPLYKSGNTIGVTAASISSGLLDAAVNEDIASGVTAYSWGDHAGHYITAVNGATGAVAFEYASSFNGRTGAIIGVNSVNGQTGTVSISLPNAPVTSVLGMTGAVSFGYVASFNGATGAVTGVSSVNGATGSINLAGTYLALAGGTMSGNLVVGVAGVGTTGTVASTYSMSGGQGRGLAKSDTKGFFAVDPTTAGKIYQFDATSHALTNTFTVSALSGYTPTDAAFIGGYLWVTASSTHNVFRFDVEGLTGGVVPPAAMTIDVGHNTKVITGGDDGNIYFVSTDSNMWPSVTPAGILQADQDSGLTGGVYNVDFAGSQTWYTVGIGGTIAIDNHHGSVVASLPLSHPCDFLLDDGNKVYALSSNSNQVSWFNKTETNPSGVHVISLSHPVQSGYALGPDNVYLFGASGSGETWLTHLESQAVSLYLDTGAVGTPGNVIVDGNHVFTVTYSNSGSLIEIYEGLTPGAFAGASISTTGKVSAISLQVTGGSPSSGMILSANDSQGNVTWVSAASSGITAGQIQSWDYIAAHGITAGQTAGWDYIAANGITYEAEFQGSDVYGVTSGQISAWDSIAANGVTAGQTGNWNSVYTQVGTIVVRETPTGVTGVTGAYDFAHPIMANTEMVFLGGQLQEPDITPGDADYAIGLTAGKGGVTRITFLNAVEGAVRVKASYRW